ncbi:hypothetical protein [Caldalkalibacillus mannanilyticus]|uniref:hypothetical protein n=1 Tax=Caldalkalibacillus mannanilyticus TaxID=1418 RepID=UPI000469575D|nr:hypothetical protein [Caldalkalibacillus mannanilyticus]
MATGDMIRIGGGLQVEGYTNKKVNPYVEVKDYGVLNAPFLSVFEVDEENDALYVAYAKSGRVAKLRLSTNEFLWSINLAKTDWDVKLLVGSDGVYLVTFSYVTKLSAHDGSVIWHKDGFTKLSDAQLKITESEALYVSSESDTPLYKINTATGRIEISVRRGNGINHLHKLCIDREEDKVFAFGPDTLYKFNGSTLEIEKKAATSVSIFRANIEIDPVHKVIYCFSQQDIKYYESFNYKLESLVLKTDLSNLDVFMPYPEKNFIMALNYPNASTLNAKILGSALNVKWTGIIPNLEPLVLWRNAVKGKLTGLVYVRQNNTTHINIYAPVVKGYY